jgi:hypothetical protein
VIVEYATLTRRDGSTAKYGRDRGRKMFVLLTPAGEPDPMGTGYSRRRLEERPNMDRNTTGVTFSKVGCAPVVRQSGVDSTGNNRN